jgi:hypothetical protein
MVLTADSFLIGTTPHISFFFGVARCLAFVGGSDFGGGGTLRNKLPPSLDVSSSFMGVGKVKGVGRRKKVKGVGRRKMARRCVRSGRGSGVLVRFG